MLSALSQRITELEALAEELAVYSVESRVASLLLKLAAATGAGGGRATESACAVGSTRLASAQEGARVELPLTQEEMAKLLGTSQETLSRKLHALEDARLIRLEGRRSVRLLHVDELARRAEGL